MSEIIQLHSEKIEAEFSKALHPNPWRHPIRWWKLRGFRRELARPRTELEQRLDLWMDEALLYGEDEARRRRILRDEEPLALAYGDLNVSPQDSTGQTGDGA